MNPAALKVHLRDLKTGGLLIVNTQAFDKRNLDKAGYAANPLDEPALAERYRLHKVDMTGLTHEAIKDLPLNTKEKDRTKNFFALGLVSWIYTRPLEPTLVWIEKRFAKNKDIAEANTRVLKAGHAFGETAEIFAEHYAVEPAEMAPGLYRAMTGNRALAWGISRPLSGPRSRSSTAPIRSLRRATSCTSSRCTSASACGPSRPKTRSPPSPRRSAPRSRGDRRHRVERPRRGAQERRHRPRRDGGVAARRPEHPARRAVDGHAHEDRAGRPHAGALRSQQRGTGDRAGAATPGDCFYIAYEAVRLAAKYMVPVIVLSDGFLPTAQSRGSSPT